MDSTHLHLMLNHLPVLGSIVGFLSLGWGIFRGYGEVKKIGLALLVLTAAAAVPVYLTGEAAEETVERLTRVPETMIERHEVSAQFSLAAAIIAGIAALGALVTFRFARTAGRGLTLAAAVLAVVTGTLMMSTANLGGQIRHTEIRRSAQDNPPPAGETQKEESRIRAVDD